MINLIWRLTNEIMRKNSKLLWSLVVLVTFFTYVNYRREHETASLGDLDYHIEGPLDRYGQAVKPKYIKYECLKINRLCGGWADRLKGIISTYALSLIMNRTFIMKITQPCHLDAILQPNEINWNVDVPIRKEYKFNLLYNFKLMKRFESIDFNKFTRRMRNYELINVHTAIMYMNSLSKNPYLQKRLKHLGFDDTSKFKVHYQIFNWYKRLFKLSPVLEAKYQTLLRRIKPNPRTFVICTQIRLGEITPRNYHDFRYTERSNSVRYWKFLNDTFVNRLHEYTNETDNYSFYITSDHESIKQEAVDTFGKERVVFNSDPTVHMDVDLSNLKDECGEIETVIIDFHMLQNCDASVVSHSGFGLLGSWNRPVPNKNLYVFTKPNQDDLRRNYWNRENMDFVKMNNLDEDLYFL